MPAITERSTKEPLIKTGRLNHGTLVCKDITVTRRFYEEVLGLEVVQTSAISLMIRKGGEYVYAVVEMPNAGTPDMTMLNHNGFEVDTRAEVDAAYEGLMTVKDEWGLKRLMKPKLTHGDYGMYFVDMDGNWWEIVSVENGGYVSNFSDDEMDMSGRHGLEPWVETWNKDKKLMHLHDPELREAAKTMS